MKNKKKPQLLELVVARDMLLHMTSVILAYLIFISTKKVRKGIKMIYANFINGVLCH